MLHQINVRTLKSQRNYSFYPEGCGHGRGLNKSWKTGETLTLNSLLKNGKQHSPTSWRRQRNLCNNHLPETNMSHVSLNHPETPRQQIKTADSANSERLIRRLGLFYTATKLLLWTLWWMMSPSHPLGEEKHCGGVGGGEEWADQQPQQLCKSTTLLHLSVNAGWLTHLNCK